MDYCLSIKPGDKVYIQSTTLAIPLLQALHEDILKRNAIPVLNMLFEKQEQLENKYAHDDFIKYINPQYQQAIESFNAYLYIRAPFEIIDYVPMPAAYQKLRRQVYSDIQQTYSKRTGTRDLRRTLCQYPTQAGAREADLSLGDFDQFIADACFLNEENPALSWTRLGLNQQHLVDYLQSVKQVTYINSNTHIHFSTEGRTWINSDGKNNMPSGEVYTSPVEDSVSGFIYFDYPFLYQQQTIQGVRLEVENGVILKGEADEGNALLQEILEVPGARQFGEVAIGTNSHITRPSKNILFDEKMAGTVHMAIGQSYLQCGGKNESAVHLDMIAEMKDSGQIWADGKLIYEKGLFKI